MKIDKARFNKAQNILDAIFKMDELEIKNMSTDINELEIVRSLVLKKGNDLKLILDSFLCQLINMDFEDTNNEFLNSYLIQFKNYDQRIMEVLSIWKKYHDTEMEMWDGINEIVKDCE